MISRLLFALVLASLVGCGFTKSNQQAACKSATEASDYFAKNIFPIMQNRCRDCHNARATYWTKSDAAYAEGLAKGQMNFSAPASSYMITKINDGHSGVANPDGMKDKILAWADLNLKAATSCSSNIAGNNGGGNTGGGTQTTYTFVGRVAIPTNLSPTTFTQLNLPVASFGAFGPAVLRFSVRQFTANPEYYEVGNFTIVGNTAPLYIENILLSQGSQADLIAKITDPNRVYIDNSFATVKRNVLAATSAAGTQISNTVTQQRILIPGNGQNYFEISAAVLKDGNAKVYTPNCTSLANFTTNVDPIISARCVSCHGPAGSNQNARAAFTMDRNNQAGLCQGAKARMQTPNLTNPDFITFPQAQNGHPATGITAAQLTSIRNWFALEN